MKIIALTTCYNRKELTLKSLDSLINQESDNQFLLKICVTDDASTDGTGKEINKKYPDINIVNGNGDLYWAGGMRYGWNQWVKHQDFDYLFVFNDDTVLHANALLTLINIIKEKEREQENRLQIVSGAFESPTSKKITHGGYKLYSKWYPLRIKAVTTTGKIRKIDTLNMNGALINKEVLSKIGFFESYFIHNCADIEYGIRLQKNNGNIWLTPSAIGVCDVNSLTGTSREPGISLIESLRRLNGIKEEPLLQRFKYFKQHAGVFYWPLLVLLPYIKKILEKTIKIN